MDEDEDEYEYEDEGEEERLAAKRRENERADGQEVVRVRVGSGLGGGVTSQPMSWRDHTVPSGICQGAPVLTGRDLRPLQGQVPGADHQRSGLNPTPREVTVDRSHPVHRDHFTQWFRLSLG